MIHPDQVQCGTSGMTETTEEPFGTPPIRLYDWVHDGITNRYVYGKGVIDNISSQTWVFCTLLSPCKESHLKHTFEQTFEGVFPEGTTPSYAPYHDPPLRTRLHMNMN